MQWLIYAFLSQTKQLCQAISLAPFYCKKLTEKGLIAICILKYACFLCSLKEYCNSGENKKQQQQQKHKPNSQLLVNNIHCLFHSL